MHSKTIQEVNRKTLNLSPKILKKSLASVYSAMLTLAYYSDKLTNRKFRKTH